MKDAKTTIDEKRMIDIILSSLIALLRAGRIFIAAIIITYIFGFETKLFGSGLNRSITRDAVTDPNKLKYRVIDPRHSKSKIPFIKKMEIRPKSLKPISEIDSKPKISLTCK